MSTVQTAPQVLDRHYLEIRCGLLNVAAALDRIDRSDSVNEVRKDARMTLIREGVEILLTSGTDRAERLQLLFSDQYIAGWNKPGG